MYAETALLCILMFGAAVMYWDEITLIFERLRSELLVKLSSVRDRLKQGREAAYYAAAGNPDSYAPAEPVKRLLSVTIGNGSDKAGRIFIVLSLLPALLFMTVMFEKLPVSLLIAGAAFTGALPYLTLSVRLRKIRAGSSAEGAVLLVELLDNYKMNFYNIREAIEVTALTIEDAPHTRKLMFDLSKGLNRAGDNVQIRKLLDNFRYSVGTSWASVLSDNIYLAVTSGMRIDAAMEDLIRTVEKAREISEFIRRENNEATVILKYLAPSCYLLTIAAGTKYFGLTAEEFIHYQFGTPVGLLWFTAALLLYLSALLVKEFLTKNRLDI